MYERVFLITLRYLATFTATGHPSHIHTESEVTSSSAPTQCCLVFVTLCLPAQGRRTFLMGLNAIPTAFTVKPYGISKVKKVRGKIRVLRHAVNNWQPPPLLLFSSTQYKKYCLVAMKKFSYGFQDNFLCGFPLGLYRITTYVMVLLPLLGGYLSISENTESILHV